MIAFNCMDIGHLALGPRLFPNLIVEEWFRRSIQFTGCIWDKHETETNVNCSWRKGRFLWSLLVCVRGNPEQEKTGRYYELGSRLTRQKIRNLSYLMWLLSHEGLSALVFKTDLFVHRSLSSWDTLGWNPLPEYICPDLCSYNSKALCCTCFLCVLETPWYPK